MSGFDLKDYVDVAQRVQDFYAKHPDGSIQSEIIELTETRVAVKAYAYRTADDPRPGVGHSWLGIPGTTPYTRGSELENAETSAWGRAIAALGFAVKGGIASRQEVMNKQGGATADGATVTLVGIVAKGGNKLDLLQRQTPDGPMSGFKLEQVQGHPGGKASIGVRAFGEAAEAVARAGEALVGQQLAISGTLHGESFTKDGREVRYQVLHLATADGPGLAFPPDAPPERPAPSGLVENLDDLPF